MSVFANAQNSTKDAKAYRETGKVTGPHQRNKKMASIISMPTPDKDTKKKNYKTIFLFEYRGK